jgi:hypothetical protein
LATRRQLASVAEEVASTLKYVKLPKKKPKLSKLTNRKNYLLLVVVLASTLRPKEAGSTLPFQQKPARNFLPVPILFQVKSLMQKKMWKKPLQFLFLN